jgi:PAS domain S-box-containing protein
MPTVVGQLALTLSPPVDGFWDWEVTTDQVVWMPSKPEKPQPVNRSPAAPMAALEALIHPDDREARREALDRYRTGITSSYDHGYRLRTVTGDWCWVRDRASIVEHSASLGPVRMIGCLSDITTTHLRQAEQAIEKAVLNIIGRAQTLFIEEENPRVAYASLLGDIVSLTGSKFGLLADVITQNGPGATLRVQAVVNTAWDQATRQMTSEREAVKTMSVEPTTLIGRILQGPNALMENNYDANKHEHALSHLSGPITTFLGLPVLHNGQPIAVLGLANRTGEYNEGLVLKMQPILHTLAHLVQTMHREHHHLRRAAEMMASLRHLTNLKLALDEHAIVAITDSQGVITEANEKFCAISQFHREELIGKTHRIVNSGRHSKEFFQQLWKTIRGGEIWQGEICNRAKDGSYYWVHTTIVPIAPYMGAAPSHYVAIRADITQRVLTEERQRTSSTIFELLATQGSLPRCLEPIVQMIEREAHQAQAYIQLAGESGMPELWVAGPAFSAGEQHRTLPSPSPTEGTRPESRQVHIGRPEERSAHNPRRYAHEWQAPIFDSSGMWLGTLGVIHPEARAQGPEDQKRLRWATDYIRLVVEHHRSRSHLATTTELLRATGAIARIGGWRYQSDTDRLIVTEQTRRICGFEPGRDLNKADLVSLFTEEARSRLEHAFDEALQGQQPFDLDLSIVLPNGSPGWVRIAGNPAATPGDAPSLYGAIQDISSRVAMERTAQQAQRMEVIGTLAGGIAHDLNNTLTPVVIAVEMVQKDHPETAEALEVVTISARRASQMVQGLLSYSQTAMATSGPLDASRLFEEVAQLARYSLPRSLKLDTYCDPSLPQIQGDPTQLHKALLNLLQNACDASASGGVIDFRAMRDVGKQSHPYAFPYARGGDFVVFRVTDAGGGIAEDSIPRIFDPFYTTKGVQAGRGLSLFTTLGAISSHEGYITVDSSPGKGSQFAVYLPVDSG